MGRSNMGSSMQHNEDKIASDFVSLFERVLRYVPSQDKWLSKGKIVIKRTRERGIFNEGNSTEWSEFSPLRLQELMRVFIRDWLFDDLPITLRLIRAVITLAKGDSRYDEQDVQQSAAE